MVFSQTSHKTQNILRVVEIDRLKANESQKANGSAEMITDGNTEATSTSPLVTSCSEEFLKPEPMFDSTMFNDTDCEFFQDLVQWCSTPAKEELVQTIDPTKMTQEGAHHTDTIHTPFSPQGWDVLDAKSPAAQAGFYNTTPNDPLSPSVDPFVHFDKFCYPGLESKKNIQFQEQFLDISSFPVVIGDLASEKTADTTPWLTQSVGWDTLDTEQTKQTQHTMMPFIDQEDSMDLKLIKPGDVENCGIVVAEYVINDDPDQGAVLEETSAGATRLSLDVFARAPSWPADVISTPEVLTYVEQLEKEKCPVANTKPPTLLTVQETGFTTTDPCAKALPVEYEAITPKSESHVESDNDDTKSFTTKRRHHDSEDSDETYTPHSERPSPRKYKRRKPSVPIKDMILALEGSQNLPKTRRGRPPKRRESTVSSICSIDENSSSMSTQELKYRELRDKNNEASKRSRMNRKLKELQMEQLAIDLEERNKKLKVRADILEDMTKRLKEALMTAILQK